MSRPESDGRGRVRGAQRDELARAGLDPLADGERPATLTVAVVVSLLLSVGVIVGALTVHGLERAGGSLPAGLFIALVLAGLARGMWLVRYWAVLGFQALLAFQILATSLALVVASSWLAAAVCLFSVLGAGWVFWKLIRVMGRIQAAERL